MALVVVFIINWAMISITHLKFRQAMAQRGVTPCYRSWAAPLSNYLCLAFMAGILVVMWLTPDTRISVSLILLWLVVLWVPCLATQTAASRARRTPAG